MSRLRFHPACSTTGLPLGVLNANDRHSSLSSVFRLCGSGIGTVSPHLRVLCNRGARSDQMLFGKQDSVIAYNLIEMQIYYNAHIHALSTGFPVRKNEEIGKIQDTIILYFFIPPIARLPLPWQFYLQQSKRCPSFAGFICQAALHIAVHTAHASLSIGGKPDLRALHERACDINLIVVTRHDHGSGALHRNRPAHRPKCPRKLAAQRVGARTGNAMVWMDVVTAPLPSGFTS